MRKEKVKGKHRVLWGFIYVGAFLLVFAVSAVIKMTADPLHGEYSVDWSNSVGLTYTDIPYGEAESNKFDLYVPADSSKESYGLVVYLHAGGFTSGDKSDDAEMLRWLCSKGYVAAGINYTLRDDAHPEASVYSQSMEIKESIPYVIAEAEKLGYTIDEMAISGGSAGGCLALLYAYRDGDTSPVPVKMVFEAVGPSSFYPEDWASYGFDQEENAENAAALFSVMRGETITADLFGTSGYDEAMKEISALLWVNEDTVPTLMAYGTYDIFQPYLGSVRLDKALTENNVPHDYIVFEHSGHALQNDNDKYAEYMQKIVEYLDTYMPVED
ncbi:MAG: alpha/beta hydrolase [Clostridia bacterium]|nr:alpha/beta hydrolase [Clostridia bacterium]